LQGRCTELSSKSRTEGRELDAEEHLRNLAEAITEREKALSYREHDPTRSGNAEEEPSRSVRIPW
jgi:hypothetical protein